MIQTIRERYQKWKDYKQSLKQVSLLRYSLIETSESIIVALAAALFIRQFFFQSSYVFSGSMIPTMQIRDRLVVNKMIYHFRAPHRGEIVLFDSPYGDDKEFVKRLIGLPGETLEIKDGQTYINDKPIFFPGVIVRYDWTQLGPIEIPEDKFFVMGDNRANSADSRAWGFVDRDDFIGKGMITFWPISNIKVLR